MRGALAPARRERRDPHGGAWAVRLVRELRPALLHRRRDRAAIQPPGRDGGHLSRHVQRGRAHRLRGGGHRRRGQGGPAQRPSVRRGDHRALRQARTLTWSRSHPPAAAGDRSARHLRRAHGAGRQPDPRLDRRATRQGERHGHLHGVSDAQEAAARGRRRRRLHRHRDGREPGRPRLRGHAAAARRADHVAARSRDGALPGAASGQARGAGQAQRRRVRVPAGGRRLARCGHGVRRLLPGRHRDPRHRREARDGARADGRRGGRYARRLPRRPPVPHQRPRHLRRRRRRGEDRLHDRRVGPRRPRGAGQPSGPHRRRRDLRPRLALPRHAGHRDPRRLRRRRRLDGAQREDPPAHGRRPTSRRSTSTRTRTRATTPAPPCSP